MAATGQNILLLLAAVQMFQKGFNMWMLKGISLGLVAFFLFTVVYWASFAGGFRSHTVLSLNLITSRTIYNPLYWAAFILILATTCVCSRLVWR